MKKLSPDIENTLRQVAEKHDVSLDAARSMLEALAIGDGRMAQFNHPEFGGSGQWMQGGMTMTSDMFNHSLKARVDGLCSELSRAFSNTSTLSDLRTSTFTGAQWWDPELGTASSVGSQNSLKYALFPEKRRLAVERNGHVTVYDTLDHQIGGFSQQQSGGSSLSFSSQRGPVDLSKLPVVSPVQGKVSNEDRETTAADYAPKVDTSAPDSKAESSANDDDVFGKIEKLSALHKKGILTDEEFTSKKSELLGRL